MNGKLYGIGVGPGDPELLTLKAKRILDEADTVSYTHLDVYKRQFKGTLRGVTLFIARM